MLHFFVSPYVVNETFRFMHERLRTHAESVAFFGGGKREKDVSCLCFASVPFHMFKCQLVL